MQKFHLSSEIQPSEVGVNVFLAISVDQKSLKKDTEIPSFVYLECSNHLQTLPSCYAR